MSTESTSIIVDENISNEQKTVQEETQVVPETVQKTDVEQSTVPAVVSEETSVEVPLLEGKEKKPWYKFNLLSYLFAPGSIRGGVFNLCSATMGAGVLSLPSAFQMGGYAACILLLIFGTFVTIFTIELLIRAREASGYTSFEDMSYQLFGKWLQYVIYLGILCFCIGCAMGYIFYYYYYILYYIYIIFYFIIIYIIYIVAVKDIFQNIISFNVLPDILQNKYYLTAIFWCLIVLPLCLLRNMDNLRFSSFFGLVCVLYIVGTIIALCCEDINLEKLSSLSLVHWDLGLIKAIPLMLFAFSSQVNVFEIQSELQGDQVKKMKRVNWTALPLALCVYVLDGFAGYAKYGEDIQGNILLNMISTPYPFVIVAFFLMVCVIVMAFPMNIFPARFTIITMIWGIEEASKKENTKWSLIRHYSLSFLLSFIILVCGLIIDDLSIVFQFIGSVASTVVCFAFPAMACLKLNALGKLEMTLPFKISTWALFIGSLIVGVVSLVTIYL
ncbi:hypothetical protein WA158_003215 [Blastocystis sp. Blastoise]